MVAWGSWVLIWGLFLTIYTLRPDWRPAMERILLALAAVILGSILVVGLALWSTGRWR